MADDEVKKPEMGRNQMISRNHLVGGGVIGAIIAIQPLMNMFSSKEVTETKFTSIQATVMAVDRKIDANQAEVMARFDRLSQSMRERDKEMESRHERDLDHITTRVETLEAARMGAPRAKNN